MEAKYRPLSADHARQYYQDIQLTKALNESNIKLKRLLTKLDKTNEKMKSNVEQNLNDLKNNFDKRFDLFLKGLIIVLLKKGFIKETHFEKVKNICDKISKGEKLSEEDKKILRESRK